MNAQISERKFRLVAVCPLGYGWLSRLRPPWVDSCQPRKWTGLPPCATTTGGFPRSDPALRYPGSHETCSTALFVFAERSLNHSHTKSCGYHVLQKCDKAQQLRALAPPPLGSFSFFLPFLRSVSFHALLLLRLTPSGTSPWISLCLNPGPAWDCERGGARRPASNVGAGTLNRNVFEDMMELYKLSNESFISLHGVHGHNECCTRL